jgi:hypothetical protein
MELAEDRINTPKPSMDDDLRDQLLQWAKEFKTSWVNLGRALYSVWRDKLYYAWGYEKFEYYVEQELGIKKQQCMKLLKTYFFLEQDEPAYLKREFAESREALNVPGYESINVLRMAKGKKEIKKDDYLKIKKDVFDKGKDATAVRKDLTAIMKERKIVDPEEERAQRNEASLKKVINALSVFKKDMETLQLLPDSIVEETEKLLEVLEREAQV